LKKLIYSSFGFPSWFRRGGFLPRVDIAEKWQEDGVVQYWEICTGNHLPQIHELHVSITNQLNIMDLGTPPESGGETYSI
jgi:hypothetical protein